MAKNSLEKTDLSNYTGQWVLISNNKVLAHNKNLSKLKKEIDECKTEPMIMKIPKGENLIF